MINIDERVQNAGNESWQEFLIYGKNMLLMIDRQALAGVKSLPLKLCINPK